MKALLKGMPRRLNIPKFAQVMIMLGVFITILTLSATAQRITGTLRGEITDQNGAAIAGAKIKATNAQTGVAQSTISNSSGNYEFPTLLPGPYSVTVESQGFRQSAIKDVTVTANNVTDRNVTLSVGSSNETVEVTAALNEVQTTTSTITNEYSIQEVLNVPTGNGSPLQLSIFA